ncbi:MAG TPA: archaetidylserine decarboxylase, partial [Anaeromyxobacteraceae bacterium]|nr:archaetidylserine decarboxylase [Anaeromyxobacteraceae bacterium]
RAAGCAARAKVPARARQMALRAFVRAFGVDEREAEFPLEAYSTLEAFFTRRLRPGARPIVAGESTVVSPVDGRVAAVGEAVAGRLLQAKGCDYSLERLLDSPLDGQPFAGGAYVTLYLSPRDYHRIHAPLGGEIEGYRYIPGDLFPVNAIGCRWVPELFCTNERLVTYLKTSAGRVAVVKVGALCVGRIRASYDPDLVTNAGRSPSRRWYEKPISIRKGEDLGVFELGSTVILLFEKNRVALDGALVEGASVRMGQAIAHIKMSGAS